MNAYKIRLASCHDIKRMLEIYTPFITQSAISFETEVPSLNAFTERFTKITEHYPWLVCEIENTIIGYAYASKHSERAAYNWSANVSVYVGMILFGIK